MPTYFHFCYHSADNPHDDINFNAKLESRRCSFIKANGQRCKRKCVIGLPCCHSHLPIQYHVQVRPSRIPGAKKGLFADNRTKGENDIVFMGPKHRRYSVLPGERICPYFGEVLTQPQLEERYGMFTAPYAIKISKDRYEDGAIQRGVGSIINHKPRSQSNCEFFVSQNEIWIRAKKRIRNGEELYVSYGNDYVLHQDGIETTTDNKKYLS